VLRRKLRRDAGLQAALGAAMRQAVLAPYAAHKSWSVKLHHDNILVLAERPALMPVMSYSTLRRFHAAHGLDKRRRLTPDRRHRARRSPPARSKGAQLRG
jgi:putative transposase